LHLIRQSCYLAKVPITNHAREACNEAGIRSGIPPESNRKVEIHWNGRVCRERNRIDCTIGQLKIDRAIAL